MKRFENLGVIKNEALFDEDKLNNFEKAIRSFRYEQI